MTVLSVVLQVAILLLLVLSLHEQRAVSAERTQRLDEVLAAIEDRLRKNDDG